MQISRPVEYRELNPLGEKKLSSSCLSISSPLKLFLAVPRLKCSSVVFGKTRPSWEKDALDPITLAKHIHMNNKSCSLLEAC
jgi:hypothetical protein